MNNPIVVPMCISVSEVEFPMQMSNNMEELEPGVASAFILNGRVTGVKGSAETDFRIGDVSLSPSDLGMDPSSYALRTELPTKTSDLTNDSGFITDADVPTKTSDLVNDSGFITNAEIPTKTSDLVNDSGFIDGAEVPSHETDPTVPQWAKSPTKPSYTASEVGAVPTSRTVNGKALSTNITLNASDVGALPSSTVVPNRTSQLTNDSGFINGSQVPSNETDPTVPSWAKAPTKPTYTASEVGALPDTTVIPSATSQLTNDSGFITSADVPTKTSDLTNDSGFITGSQVPSHETDPTVPSWAKASSKPSYTASEVGALPDTTVIPSATSQLTNDSGFITSSAIPTNVSAFANNVPYAVANSDGASLSTMAIPYGSVDSTSTSTAYTATVPGITELKTGVCMMLHNGVVTSASGFTIDINGLGAKPSYNNLTNATRDTTIYNIAYTMLFVYDESLDDGDGGWWCYRGYDANTNTIGYQIRTNSSSLPMQSVTYRYRILFTDMDGTHFVPPTNSTSTNATSSRTVNQAPIDPFGRIVYYGATASVATGSRPSASALWQEYTLSLGYSFNRTGSALTLTSWKPVYVKATPQADGSAIIDATTPYVQDLPTTEDGKIYIYLGIAYSATSIELTLEHPVKHYSNGTIRNWFPTDYSSAQGRSF